VFFATETQPLPTGLTCAGSVLDRLVGLGLGDRASSTMSSMT
jgi:hypothetical protein